MKYIILLGDGMADYPLAELKGKTPLEYAHIPNMDIIASQGTLGMIDTIPAGFSPGSDVAIMTVLGYDPQKYYTGRGPLEAASMGLQLRNNDVAFRCNLVTLAGNEQYIMEDFTADHITTQEARTIIHDINKELGTDDFQFYPGVGYRHLLVWKDGKYLLETTPPHDITGKVISDYLPRGGDGANQLKNLMKRSQVILKDHPVNRLRLTEGKKPASSIWLWGQGRAPRFEKLTVKYNLRGGMISAVDLLNGIGVCAGLKVINVEGATGYIDTNYSGKARRALDALREMDFVFVHVEAPDEMGHEGNIEGKIRAIEDFDKKVVGTILEDINKIGPFRLLILSDHPTPISLRTHASDPSPFAVLSSDEKENLKNGSVFSESSAKSNGIMVSPGHLLIDDFIKNWRRFVKEKSC
ncbi:MAG TPA: cofactor-independent phosphoglycerate mutase [Syntrophales bacterium]|nr:cofactor-independent phosphoglycerate mutase [Syntrophales bacterium]